MPYLDVKLRKHALRMARFAMINFVLAAACMAQQEDLSFEFELETTCNLMMICLFYTHGAKDLKPRVDRSLRDQFVSWSAFDAAFSNADCHRKFRFLKPELKRLLTCLHIPAGQYLKFNN